MRQTAAFFGETELDLLYIAKRLQEALEVEQVLTEAGIDYLVEVDHYRGGIIFARVRVGAFFYVPVENLERARQVLREHGRQPWQVVE